MTTEELKRLLERAALLADDVANEDDEYDGVPESLRGRAQALSIDICNALVAFPALLERVERLERERDEAQGLLLAVVNPCPDSAVSDKAVEWRQKAMRAAEKNGWLPPDEAQRMRAVLEEAGNHFDHDNAAAAQKALARYFKRRKRAALTTEKETP